MTSKPAAALAIASMLTVWSALAADQPSPPNSSVSAAEPVLIRGKLENATGLALMDELHVIIEVTALEDIFIQPVTISATGSLSKVYAPPIGATGSAGNATGSAGNSEGLQCEPLDANEELGKNQIARFECSLRPSQGYVATVIQPRFLFRGGVESELRATLTWSRDDDLSFRTTSVSVPISLKAPISAVIFGGLVGALVLSIFTLTQRFLEKQDLPQNTLAGVWETHWVSRLGAVALRIVMQSVAGTLCAVVLITLANITDAGSPPIAVSVKDFWGGMVIGLFSVPLAKWVGTKLNNANAV